MTTASKLVAAYTEIADLKAKIENLKAEISFIQGDRDVYKAVAVDLVTALARIGLTATTILEANDILNQEVIAVTGWDQEEEGK